MNTTPVTRRNPMEEVVPFELLEVAHSLIEHGQNEAYWKAVPVPKRPVGQVRFEVARQVATFAVPLAGVAAAFLNFGLKGGLASLPVAWLVGFLLDANLKQAISQKLLRDMSVDGGRYRAVKWLASEMGMAEAEVTLEVVFKMAKDYVIVKSLRDKEAARQEAAARAADAKAANRRIRPGAAGAAALAAGSAGFAAAEDSSYELPPPVNHGLPFSPAVNPTTGLPMIGGTYTDTSGNVFGTDSAAA